MAESMGLGGLQIRLDVPLGQFRVSVDVSLPGKGVSALFGPSGCGKTSILRCVAGLHQAPRGRVQVNGAVWQDSDSKVFLPTHKRSLGYVFQEASLFAHLSVKDNLLYGRRRKGLGETEESSGRVSWGQTIALLGLERLLDRAPDRLSGGERQRVAIGRALLSDPALLLMDEPLSALDTRSKSEILPYLEELHDALSIPVLYVSHAMAEVERLADHVVRMEEGRAAYVGPLTGFMARNFAPGEAETVPSAGASGGGGRNLGRDPEPEGEGASVLNATVDQRDVGHGLSRLLIPGGSLLVAGPIPEGVEHCRVRIPASGVILATAPPDPSMGLSVLNALPAVVEEGLQLDPARMVVRLRLGEAGDADGAGAMLLCRVTRKSWVDLGLEPGSPVYALIKGVAVVERGGARLG